MSILKSLRQIVFGMTEEERRDLCASLQGCYEEEKVCLCSKCGEKFEATFWVENDPPQFRNDNIICIMKDCKCNRSEKKR